MLPYVTVCCRLLLGAVFLLSVGLKLRSRRALQDFLVSARSLLGVNPRLAGLLAAASIVVEVLIVILLVLSAYVVAGFVLSFALLVAYSAAIGLALRRGVRTPCRCIGTSSDPLNPSLLIRNAGLLVACVVGLLTTLGSAADVGFNSGLAATAAIALFGVALVTSFDDIVYLARRSAS